jgi:hypothetical protein
MKNLLKKSGLMIKGLICIEKRNSERVLFCHIPKSGGTSVDYLLSKKLEKNYLKLTHGFLRYELEKYEDFYRFSIIRDPVERLVSTYFYQKNTIETLRNEKKLEYWQGGNWNIIDKLYERYKIKCINSFLCNYREFYFNEIEPFRKRIQEENPLINLEVAYQIGFIPQNEFICDGNGKLLVNDAVNLANLSEFMKKRFKIEEISRNNTHKNSLDNYNNYIGYNEALVVKEIYNLDYKYFGEIFKLNK